MLTVKIGITTIKFKNNFDDITVAEFAKSTAKELEVERVLNQIDSISEQIKEFEQAKRTATAEAEAEIQNEILLLRSMVAEDIVKARILRVEQIAILTDSPAKTEEFLLTTKGINFDSLGMIVAKVNDGFGDFQKYFDQINGVESFAFQDYKRHGLLRRKRCVFHVADLGNHTVLRDAAAMIVAQQIGQFTEQFKANSWNNFARFVAYVARPKKEKYEYQPRLKWLSFIGGKIFERMSPSDRVSSYNKKLEETVEARTEIFQNLPMTVAIGVYKYYFFLKKNFLRNSKVFTRKTRKQRKRQKNTTPNLA